MTSFQNIEVPRELAAIQFSYAEADMYQVIGLTGTLKEGANKSYGTRAFTGNPLILND